MRIRLGWFPEIVELLIPKFQEPAFYAGQKGWHRILFEPAICLKMLSCGRLEPWIKRRKQQRDPTEPQWNIWSWVELSAASGRPAQAADDLHVQVPKSAAEGCTCNLQMREKPAGADFPHLHVRIEAPRMWRLRILRMKIITHFVNVQMNRAHPDDPHSPDPFKGVFSVTI